MALFRIFSLIFLTFFVAKAQALVYEVGLSYGYSKKTFNATNYYQTDSKTASLSLYFSEKWIVELSYTDSFYESQESDSNSTRTVQQSSQISDSSLVYMLLDRRSFVQPYIKGGAAYIKKNQTIKYLNASAIDLPQSAGWAPSYGGGLKFALTERFSIKLSYDVWQTPLSDGTNSDDTSFKAGLTWLL
jgi:opacity protein-like surface antigen